MSSTSSVRCWLYRVTFVLVTAALAAGAAAAESLDPLAVAGPVAGEYPVRPAGLLPVVMAVPLDIGAVRAEDEVREMNGLPPRFAIPESTWLTPEDSGAWEDLDGRYQLWRLRISAPGALSLNLGFTGYHLPVGARLSIYPADVTGPADDRGLVTFTDADNEDHGELWTPVILADEIVVELVLPRNERRNYRLELTAINQGYRFFGEDPTLLGADKAGTCNVDVVCPEGDDWRDQISSVGVISTGGSTFCTGVMMNNTAADGKPYFLTAFHCNINVGTAASLVVYWNFQSPICGDQSGGLLDQFMTGSTFLAGSATSDFTLVLMDDEVVPAHGVIFAGWNRSTDDPTNATAIHHPRGDEKSISFEHDPLTTTTYFSNGPSPGDGTHLRVADWDVGTTEPGSSGSPLFDQDKRVVGQLHGGEAACGNDDPDWYGRFSVSWEGDGTADTRLRDYLDAGNTGATVIDFFDPQVPGFLVTPANGGTLAGVSGGPFVPASLVFTVTNNGTGTVDFTATTSEVWLSLDSQGGSLSENQHLDVTASLTPAAATMPSGVYHATIEFVNPGGGPGTTTREVVLSIESIFFSLLGPAPNPFTTPPVKIFYNLPGSATVRAGITNLRGLKVRDLGSHTGHAGKNFIEWDGLDGHGRRVPSGVYVVAIEGLGQTLRTNVIYAH